MSEFVHERSVDEANGRSKLVVMLEGRVCLQRPIPGKLARSYVGFVSILKDLGDVLAFIREAHRLVPLKGKSDDSHEVKYQYSELSHTIRLTVKALFFSAVALYGRCFVSASGRGTTLSPDSHIDPKFKATHERIIGFRHRLVAHAGDAFDDGEAIVVFLMDDHRFHVAANIWRLDFEDDRSRADGFERLVEHLIEQVNAKQSELLRKLIDGPGLAIVREQQTQ